MTVASEFALLSFCPYVAHGAKIGGWSWLEMDHAVKAVFHIDLLGMYA